MLIRLLSCVLVWWIVIDHTAAQESPATPHVSALTSELAVAPTVVRVQLDLTIANPSREEREHVLDLRVPESAAVDRFGLWVQGRYLEGEIAPRALGRRLYREVSGIDDPARVKRDPALLTWEGPGHLRLRVFPVPPEGSARLRLSYVVLRPLRGELAIPAVLAAEAPRSPAIADPAQIIPALPPPADQVRVQAFSAKAGEPGYFLAVIPIAPWEQQRPVLKPDLELILRDTSRRMAGRYAPGTSLQRELASRLAAAHPVFLLDADVVPHPVVALDARSAGSEPSCGGLFDLAAALCTAEMFLAAHPGKQVHLTVLGDAEPECGAALTAAPVMPQVPGGHVRLVCVGSPSWVRAFAPALIDERAFTDVQLSGVDGVSDLGPTWLPRAVPGEHLLVFGRHQGERGTIRIRQRAPDGSSRDHSIALTFQPDPDASWLPRLWADARVRDLAHTTGDPAAVAERERHQHDLARTYQVLAPASSFVVLSNERDYRANALERTARVSGWAEREAVEVISEAPADPWGASSGQGSRFFIQSERPTTGVDRAEVWTMATSPHGQDYTRNEYLHRYLHRDESGRWNDDRWLAGLAIPAGSWASSILPPDLTGVPPAVVARWGGQVSPVIAVLAGERWCWWRDGEQAVLQHLTADGTSDWCVVIDQDGIRTALPEWGVWWRHVPDQRLVDCLLKLAPSPTWLPLSWLSRFFHITSEARGDTLQVALFPRSPEQDMPPTMTVRGFLLPASGEVALVHWATHTHHNRDHRLVLTPHGERIMVRAAEGDEWEVTLQPAPPHSRALPLPIDRPVVGVLDAAPLWRRLHTGATTAGDCWQMALAAPHVAESLPWLERAHGLAPHDPGIILHLAAALSDSGHQARVPALLARLDALDLPAWQRPGVGRLRRELTNTELDTPARRPRLEWPQVWTAPRQSDAEETALMQQIGDAVKQEQADRLAELLCQSTSGRVYYHGIPGTPPLTVMQAVFGDDKLAPRWQVPAARQVLARLAQDPRGRAFFRNALRNGGSEVIHAHLRDLLRDPAQVDLARLTLSPYFGKGHHPRRFSRRELLDFSDESYPPVVRTLAWVRLIRDHTWSIDDRAAAEADLRRRLAAITQPDLRLRVMGDSLDLLAGDANRWSHLPSAVDHLVLPNLYDDASALWDAALVTHAAIRDPLAHAAGQPDLERVLEHVVTEVVITHRRTDLTALSTRLCALPSTALSRPAFGHLRPLVVQLCRQAAAAGLKKEALLTADTVFANAPEPGLLAALTGATPHDLAIRFDEYQRSFEGSIDVCTAPLAWWPEWQEDAAALVRRCRSGVRQPDARTSHVIRERGLSHAVVAAAATELPQQGPDLHWLAFTAPVDAAGARQVLAALPAMRQALGMPTHAAYAALHLAFRHGLLAEAQRELAALRAIAARPADLVALQVAIAALDGDGSTALTHARAWIAARAPDDDLGEIYARGVELLCATRRYQDAFVLRQEALAFVEAAPAGAKSLDRSTWHWDELFSSNHPVLDQAVVPEGTVLFPRDWKPSDGFLLGGADEPQTDPAVAELAAQAALGRYPAIAAEAAAGFAQADTARRFAWFGALWIALDQRLGADCPPLVAWLRELVAKRAPLPPQHVVAILQVVAPASADAWVAYLHQARSAGQMDISNLLSRSRQVAEGTMDVAALLAIAEIDGKSLPERDWIWNVKEEPPAFTAHLAELALQRARASLTGTINGYHGRSMPEDRAWVAKHPDVRARIDALADALLAERPDDLLLWARCAGLGLGTKPADPVWRQLANSPVDAVDAMRDGVLDDEIGSGCLRVLIADGRWDDLVTFLRRCKRAGVSFSMKGVPERSKLMVMAQHDGAVAAANALAAMTRDSDWLISAGYPDPATHPDWDSYRELTWTLRGNLERLEAHAQQVFDDPFATWERQEYAYAQIIAVHLWRRDYQTAVWTISALAGEDSPLGGPTDAARVRWQRESTGGFSGPWGDIEQLLCDDWIRTIDPRSPTREEQADARAEQMLARRLGFLHHCAHALVDAIPTSALLMSLDALRDQGYLPIDRSASVMADLARVLRRCIDRGLQERLRELLRDGGQLPWPELATVETYPVFTDLWLLRARLTGEARWPYGDHQKSSEAWRGLPPNVQRDLLRQVSDLTRLAGADAWWPEWREDSNLRELIPELMPVEPPDPTDPAAVPATPVPDPWLGQIPPPEVWLAREAWWRTGGAARIPEQ